MAGVPAAERRAAARDERWVHMQQAQRVGGGKGCLAEEWVDGAEAHTRHVAAAARTAAVPTCGSANETSSSYSGRGSGRLRRRNDRVTEEEQRVGFPDADRRRAVAKDRP